MESFSSSAEDSIYKKITLASDVPLISSEAELVHVFDLEKCLDFIRNRRFLKVCLQFPDYLLKFSVQIALWLENHLSEKIYILGDTSYGSCCVDELAAEHVNGDAVIHMGHACLSPTSRLPVFYVLPRASLNISHFITVFNQFCSQSTTTGSILVLYDVAYTHLYNELHGALTQFDDTVVVSQTGLPENKAQVCGPACIMHQGSSTHQTLLLGRSFCCPSTTFSAIVYIAHTHTQNMLNFALTFRDIQFFTYTGGEIETMDFNKILRRRLFLVEKIKDAKSIGIIVGTLSVKNFLEAIERIKKLAAYRGKRCYVFSVGKPNPAKLANFPEIDVFVMVSCPEACLENEKEYMQPMVTLLEAELAFNSNRCWDDKISVDFRDLLEGASHHQPLPEGCEPLTADVSLIDNRIRSDTIVVESESTSQLSLNEHYQISVANSYNAKRSWRGLQQDLGETPVCLATKGRSGIAMAYDEEKTHQIK